VVTRSNPQKGKSHGQDYTKTSFGRWFSPVIPLLFEEIVKMLKVDYYTKKLNTRSFQKVLLFVQLHETESRHPLSDCLLDDVPHIRF
jgi:putative transposase